MRCPTLKDLPPPPEGKTGWPWTEETPQLPDRMPDGGPWPRISIVTPSYNQGEFIEETIRSVLLQGYPDLEYIIIDGGSTDNSVEIIKKYDPWLKYWVSEPDRGQAHAINKGFQRCTGEWLNWLNSDDILLPYSLKKVAIIGKKNKNTEIVTGCRILQTPEGEPLMAQTNWRNSWIFYIFNHPDFPQDATFLHKTLIARTGNLDERFHYLLDVEYYYRALQKRKGIISVTDATLSSMKIHNKMKTLQNTLQKKKEYEIIKKNYNPFNIHNISFNILFGGRRYILFYHILKFMLRKTKKVIIVNFSSSKGDWVSYKNKA